MAIARKKEEYSKKEAEDLIKNLEEKEKQLLEANMSIVQGKTKNIHSSRNIRREIARIKTAIKSKRLGD